MNRRWLPYLQLIRLPNVFTAMADMVLGALATGALPDQWLRFGLLLLASCFLYCSGMVWNDFFDIKQDERERPFRPLPSGKVKRSTALVLALGLMLLGIVFSGAADLEFSDEGEPSFRPFSLLLALGLCIAILLYDGWLKRTWAGPVAMGTCRFLNVLLGLSVASLAFSRWHLLLALVVGGYIVGVTWFARTEARESHKRELALATGVMAVALALSLFLPPEANKTVPRDVDGNLLLSFQVWLGQLLFPFLLVLFAFYLGQPLARAIHQPTPRHVQTAVKRCILGLVALDALLATLFVGPLALLLLVLLLPARYLGKWVYST